MFDLISRLKDPAIFQGSMGKRHYFEGWYFKQIGLDGAKFAVIPGISLTGKESHAFIQVFNGRNGESNYFSYHIEDFKAEKEPFGVKIGGNRFSYRGIELDIKDTVKGSLEYSEIVPYRYSWKERGVMGWYGYVPFMETYHGLLSLDHRVDGLVNVGGDIHVFEKGDGYMEKDWGESFPSSWIWMQSNSFEEKGTSLMLSIAVIPWLGSSFIGHLAIIHVGGNSLNLSTYKGGKITKLEKTANELSMKVATRNHVLEINAFQGESVTLKSPKKGLMTGRTIESLNSRLEVKLSEINGNKVFQGTGLNAGLEIMDKKNKLIRGLNLAARASPRA